MVRYFFELGAQSKGLLFFFCASHSFLRGIRFVILVSGGRTTHKCLYSRVIPNVTDPLAQFPVVVYLFTLKNCNIRDRFAPLDLCNRFISMFSVIRSPLEWRQIIKIIIICNISQGSDTHTHTAHRTPHTEDCFWLARSRISFTKILK